LAWLATGAASTQRDWPAGSSFLRGFVNSQRIRGSCSSVNLPEDLIALLRQPTPCFLATVMPDGSPQLTQTWVDTDGEHVVINTVRGHQKVKNIERDPRVAECLRRVQAFALLRDPRPGRQHHCRGRRGAHRSPCSALPWCPVPVVRRPRPGPGHPGHQGGQDPRDGVARHHGSAQEPPRRARPARCQHRILASGFLYSGLRQPGTMAAETRRAGEHGPSVTSHRQSSTHAA